MMSLRLLLVFVLFFLLSCGKDPLQVDIYSIPDEFRVDLHQSISPEGTHPSLMVSTLESRQCSNDNLIVQFTISEIGLLLNILDINQAFACNEVVGKLATEISTGLTPGMYPISIVLKDQILNEGILNVTDQLFQLNLKTDHGIEVGKVNILKIPDGLIWGYIVKSQEQSFLGHTLYERLQPMMSAPDPLDSGDYGLFTIEEENGFSIYNLPGINLERSFLMKMKASVNEVKEIIRQFKEDHPELEFKIYSSRGIIN